MSDTVKKLAQKVINLAFEKGCHFKYYPEDNFLCVDPELFPKDNCASSMIFLADREDYRQTEEEKIEQLKVILYELTQR